MIIAVDFDGTVVDHRFPEIGLDVPGAVEALHKLTNARHQIILWTIRSGTHLDEAVRWFSDRKIPLFGINSNPDQPSCSCSPKVFAQVYIDDRAYGCPLIRPPYFTNPCVNWSAIHIV